MASFKSRTTSEDLQISIDGENFEVEEMYQVYLEVTHTQKEYAVEVSYRYAWEAEKTHAVFFKRAKDADDSREDLKPGSIFVCTVCGYTVEGETPDNYPVCKAKKERFRIF